MKNKPQNRYFPANAERMDVHCLESGCIVKYIPPLGSVRIQSELPDKSLLKCSCLLNANINRLYPYTAERRDVLGNTSPSALEISNTE